MGGAPKLLSADYRWAVEREEIARDRRREQAREQLEFERERESMLLDQLADVITEQLGPELDEAAFAQMAPADAAIVRAALGTPTDGLEEDAVDDYAGWADVGGADEADAEADMEAEIARLETELLECRRRQRAHESYRGALGGAGGATGPA